jgi:hypothetical protein
VPDFFEPSGSFLIKLHWRRTLVQDIFIELSSNWNFIEAYEIQAICNKLLTNKPSSPSGDRGL